MALDTNFTVSIDYDTIEKDVSKQIYSSFNLEPIQKIIKDIQEEQIKNNVIDITDELILASNEFLYAVKQAQEKIYKAEKLGTALKRARDKYINTLKDKNKDFKGKFDWKSEYESNIQINNTPYSNYTEIRDEMTNLFNDQVVKELVKKADIFNQKVVKILQKNRNLKTTIIVEDSNGNPVVYEVTDMEKLIEEKMSFGYTSGSISRLAINFNISSSQVAEKLSYLKRVDTIENEDNYAELNKLKTVYKDIIKRYSLAKGNYILWKIGANKNKWKKAKVGQRGDITETYGYLFYSKKYINMFGSDREHNVELYMLTQQAQVDAMSGLFQGDIKGEELNLDYDYAIKQGNASFLSIQQMVPLAEQILINAKNKNQIKAILDNAYDKDREKHEKELRTKISNGAAGHATKSLRTYIK